MRRRLAGIIAVTLLGCLAGCTPDPAGGTVVRGWVAEHQGVVEELRDVTAEVRPWVQEPSVKRPVVLQARLRNNKGERGRFVFLVDLATGRVVDMRQVPKPRGT